MKRRAFDRIVEGLHDAIAIAEGRAEPGTYDIHVPAEVDVKALRAKLGMTQAQFAARYRFSAARLRDWEQGRSRPDGAVHAYLTVITREPEAVSRALRPASGRSDGPAAEKS